ALAMLPFAIMIGAAAFLLDKSSFLVAIAAQFGVFFVVALACHGELARLRPPASRLTEFYFWMSLGGVVGGAATQLIAPLIFREIVEYPLVLAFVCLLRPGFYGSEAPIDGRARTLETTLLIGAIALVLWNPAASFSPRISHAVFLF